MRILVLGTDIYGGHGGIALYNRDLVRALSTLPGCEEVVVIPRIVPMPGAHDGEIPSNVRFVASAANGKAAYLAALFREIRGRRFDRVICAHVNLLPVARLFAKDPLLVLYGIEAWQRLRDPLSNRLLHRCRGIIAISAVTRDRFLAWSHYRGPMHLLPNAIHAERYGIRPKNPALVARYGLQDKRVLLTVGRLSATERYKGFDEVIEVLGGLPAGVVHLIAGTGDDRERVQEKARTLGVSDRVIFTGLFTDDEKADLYALADVFVMPSRGEGFGFVFLEALASGVPVIAGKHDGGREAVRDGELGSLVDPANRTELRDAILDLLDRRGTRTIPAGLDYFSFANFEKRLHAIVAS